jgi:signal transduction histidine kinase
VEALVGKNASGGSRGQALDLLVELEKTSNIFEAALRKKGITLKVVTRTQDVLRIDMAPDRFQRLLAILILNSMDWIEGWPKPEIRITVHSSPKHCELVVSDNGPGILPDISDRIFEPLFSGKEGGRGMGLAIARHILSDCGGTIELLLDRRRIGTSFRLSFPRRRPKRNNAT